MMGENWKQTYTGKRFEFSDPISHETICIEDIAHSLSMQCRYNGHIKVFYSVAEHCVAMSYLMSTQEAALGALLHDAAEAYTGDIITPLKTDAMHTLEDRIMTAILSCFGVYVSKTAEIEIKKADLRMMATEKEQLLVSGHKWDTLGGVDPYCMMLQGWTPAEAKDRFLKRFIELTKEA